MEQEGAGEQKAADDAQGSNSPAPVVAGKVNRHEHTGSADQQAGKGDAGIHTASLAPKKRSKQWLAVLAILVSVGSLIASGLSASYTSGQLEQMKEANRISEEAYRQIVKQNIDVKRQADAAEVSNKETLDALTIASSSLKAYLRQASAAESGNIITKEAVQIARESLNRSDRPWVSISIEKNDQPIPSFTMKLVNSGRTPATNLNITGNATITKRFGPPISINLDIISHASDLFPNDHHEDPIGLINAGREPIFVSNTLVNSLPYLQSEFVVYRFKLTVKISYKDIDGVNHQTPACFLYNYTGAPIFPCNIDEPIN